MNIVSTPLEGLLLLEPKQIADKRGFFSEVFRADELKEHGFECSFVQDNHAFSAEVGVLRGLHYQSPPYAQAKLVRVTRGRIWCVVVDLRKQSTTFGEWYGVELSVENWRQLLVPVGFAHGYVTLEPDTEVLYKVTEYYVPAADKGILWSDVDLHIDWKLEGRQPVLSEKDEVQPVFADIVHEF